ICETKDLNYEHDGLIIYKDKAFIIEVKSGKFREPLRDIDKSFNRIKDDFKRENSIQKAYIQALRLKKIIESKKEFNLFSKKNGVIRVDASNINETFIICITAERQGILSVNLSLLLEKDENEPYPWSCNIDTLEQLIDFCIFKGLTIDSFISYLRERSIFHEKFLTSDELEIFSYFFLNKTLKELVKGKDLITFDPSITEIFNDMYFGKTNFIKKADKKQIVSYKNNYNDSKKKNKKKISNKSKAKNRKK
ncbi:MAG: hypothetical protein ACK4IX_09725, partial [Candidatus Sericytochromatia bacterium]